MGGGGLAVFPKKLARGGLGGEELLPNHRGRTKLAAAGFFVPSFQHGNRYRPKDLLKRKKASRQTAMLPAFNPVESPAPLDPQSTQGEGKKVLAGGWGGGWEEKSLPLVCLSRSDSYTATMPKKSPSPDLESGFVQSFSAGLAWRI